MKKRIMTVIMVLQLLLAVSSAYADTLMPCADLVFQEATPILCSGKCVVFSALVYEVADSVSVTSVLLEQKVNDTWKYVTNLSCPASQTSCFRYSQTEYYTSEIGTGTYRVVVTFCADGHSITRTSNERTF